MKIYSIRNWNVLYENNRSRELKKLDWVPLPNKHDGDGYTFIMSQEDGASIFGAFVAITQISSRGKHPAGGCGNPAGCCECRGSLLREGSRPHDAASLARMSRIPLRVIERMLQVCASDEVKWLEIRVLDEPQPELFVHTPQGGAGIPQGGDVEGKGREQDLSVHGGEEISDRIRAIHGWYGQEMAPTPLDSGRQVQWAQWFSAGFEEADFKLVIAFIKRQLATGDGKRQTGALKLSNLLQPTTFADELAIAKTPIKHANHSRNGSVGSERNNNANKDKAAQYRGVGKVVPVQRDRPTA